MQMRLGMEKYSNMWREWNGKISRFGFDTRQCILLCDVDLKECTCARDEITIKVSYSTSMINLLCVRKPWQHPSSKSKKLAQNLTENPLRNCLKTDSQKKTGFGFGKMGMEKMKNQTCAFDHQLMSETIDVSEHTTFY